MAELIGDRPLRGCEACGAVDDHPKHSVLVAPDDPAGVLKPEILQMLLDNGISAAALIEIQDTQTVLRHVDCCAAKGCPTGICEKSIQGWDGTTGLGMMEHLEGVTY
jgi:hypothetical protein